MSTSMTAAETSSRRRGKPNSAGPRAPASNLPSAATGAPRPNTTMSICRAGSIDLSAFGLPGVNVDPNIHLVKLGLNYRFGDTPPWVAPAIHAKPHLPESDRLERARANDLPAFSLSRLPFALCGPEQPAGRRTGPRDLDHDGLPGRAAVAGRRILFRPRTRAGFRPERNAGPCRFSQWRGAEGRRRIPEIPAAALLLQADLRARRRTGRRRGCRQSAARQARHRPRHADRRPLCGRRFLRRQLLRQGSARRFHELGDVVVGRLRLPRRPAGLYPRRRGRVQPQGLGGARRRVRGADRAQQRRPRHPKAAVPSSNSRSVTRSSISPANCGSARSPTAAIPAITGRRWRSRRPTPRSTSTL